MKRYVYVRILFVFLILFGNMHYSFAQDIKHVEGNLTYNYFGYPTLYGLDSTMRDQFLDIMEARHLKRKYKSIQNEYEVYHKLKRISWQEYPCVEVALNNSDSSVFVYMNVDDYHKIIVKNQEELNKDSMKVFLELSLLEIIPGYYRLSELENAEFVNNPVPSNGKLAKMDYAW